MGARMKDPEVLELSLEGQPKNGRRYLMLKGQGPPAAPAEPVKPVEPPAEQATEPTTETLAANEFTGVNDPSPSEPPSEPVAPVAVEQATVDGPAIVRAAYAATLARSTVAPKPVVDALGHIMSRAGVEPVEPAPPSLDPEAQVHVRSLVALVEGLAELPPDVAESVQVVRAWVAEGFPLVNVGEVVQSPGEFGYDAPEPALATPAPKRVVDSGELVEYCRRRARQLVETGSTDVAAELLSFCKKVQKALPDGGFVVVSGVVPKAEGVPLAQLSDLVSSGKPDFVSLLNSIVDDACTSDYSQAETVLAEAADALQAFTEDTLKVLASPLDGDGKLLQIQQAFSSLGAKVKGLVERSGPPAADAVADRVAELVARELAPLRQDLELLKRGRSLSFTEAPVQPQPKSIRPSPGVVRSQAAGKPLTASQIAEAAASRHLGKFSLGL